MHHVTNSHSKAVLNLELFITLVRIKSKESFIMPAGSNMTKDLSLVLMGSMDLVKAIKYKNADYWKTFCLW